MPKDLKTSIDFFQAYHNFLKEPARDTIRDTIADPQDTLPQDTLPQDAVPRDTVPGESISPDTSVTEEPAIPDTTSLQQGEDSIQQQPTGELRRDTPEQTPEQTPEPAQAQRITPSASSTTPRAGETEITDSVAVLHEILGVTELPIGKRLQNDPAHHNFLYHIPSIKPRDSISVEEIYQPTRQSPKQLTEQQVQPQQEIPVKNTRTEGYDWITFVLVASLLLIGWTRLFYKKYFISLVKSFHFHNYASSLYFGRNSVTQRASVFLNLNFFIITGVLAFQTLENMPYTLDGIQPLHLWVAFSVFFMTWYAWNFLMSRFIGFVFLRQRVFSEYLHNYNLYRKIAGISLFPIAVIIQFIQEEYREIFLLAGGIIFGIIFLVHIIRGLQVFLKEGISIFYLFLYLCALEFLPIILVFEVFIRHLSS